MDKITMEDVYRDWDSRIARTILNAGIPFEAVDDVKSDIYLSMIRRGLCERFDPARAKCFSTYLYKVVHSLVSNQHRKFHTNKTIPYHLVSYLGDKCLDDINLFSGAIHSYNALTEIERLDFIEQILTELDRPENHKVLRGDLGTMPLKTAVLMVFQGYSFKDIGDTIGARADAVKRGIQSVKSLFPVDEYHALVDA